MQFKVPQNIDMADRIVGPLTLVQFLYVLVGGIIVYFLFSTIAPVNGLLFLVTALPIAIFSLALAFLKVQDQPFPRFVLAFVVYLTRPKQRLWHKDGTIVSTRIVPETEKIEDTTVKGKKIAKSQLEQLIHVMDTGATPSTPVVPKAAHVSPSLNRLPELKHPVVKTTHGQK